MYFYIFSKQLKISVEDLLKTSFFFVFRKRHDQGSWGGGGGRKGSSFCGIPTKELQSLRPAASKVMILWLWHHQDSQVAIYIDAKP